MRKAVFLDRDGTIIEDRGCLRDHSEVSFIPGAFEALQRLQKEFLLFIVTNQPGIAQGAITCQDVDGVNAYVVARLAEAGVRITDVYVCPHAREDGCSCIKPHPHFLHEAAARYQVDLRQSFTIGDHPHDVELARALEGRGIYVLTGHGEKHRAELTPGALVAEDIGQAAERILTASGSQVEAQERTDGLRRAVTILRNGGTVAFPTETVYGLGANAFDANAVARVFEIKQRPRFDPLIVHVASVGQADEVVREWPVAAAELARRFWPGPLTLVLPKADRVPEIVTAGLPTVAVRMPDHLVALSLIAEAAVPIAAPSANRFGSISPTTSEHVRSQLGQSVDLVLDGGPCLVGIESTIVSLAGDSPALLRAGGTPLAEIEEVLGPIEHPAMDPGRPTAPGQCPRHYAPQTPLILIESVGDLPVLPRSGLLTLTPAQIPSTFDVVEVLSDTGDLREAAAGLFAALHRLDAMGLDVIIAVKVPEEGLGPAINDRLRRAAHMPATVTVPPSVS